ncbi:unnamed protein product [Plutella xylostella]|uniref:RNA-directed DNA polymerase n=1 Tax=Plutella xylostella TaxID=51655 RepID=A0A8S4G2X7_PLUXY|nr:unnamed protein product [Plutella xylostella]
MSEDPKFANADYAGPLGAKQMAARWEEVQDILNELGPEKNIIQWKQDIASDKILAVNSQSTPEVQNKNQSLSNELLVDASSSINDLSHNESNIPTAQSQCDVESLPESTRLIVEALKSFSSSRSQNYFVSNFDPSIHNIDVWCEEVDRARISNNWQDSECLSRVAGCLRGDARTWLNEWVTQDRSWSNFVREFKPLCPRKLDYANILCETITINSDKFLTYAEYARRMLLRLRIVKGLSEELMVSLVIRGITDPQVRAAAANANLNSEDLVSFLSIYTKPNRSKVDPRQIHGKKRPMHNQNNTLKCFNCGQIGHKSNVCPKKPKLDQNSSSSQKPFQNSESANSSKVTCNFCKKPGHAEDSCFAKDRARSQNKRNVNLCSERPETDVKNTDVVTAVIQGVPIDVLIDSGALNISMISADVLKYFSCEKKPTRCTLKGISDGTIEADSFVTLTVEFAEISIEADFVIVPGTCMSFPLIVGTDILNRDGVTYIRTKDRQYLTHSSKVAALVNSIVVDEPNSINSPLLGPERVSLLQVIKDFRDFLITGTATTTVTTGKMHINLTNNTPVAYRPYKLSHQEKLIVRDIVRDLLEKGIIRESNSEYASPIILVKKKDGSDRMCVDYRALNKLTSRERYPLPLIDDHIDRLGHFKFFSSLDMATGFHQMPIDEASIHKTAFVTPEGHYEYLRMPYGLTNSPIVYQRIINKTLRSHIEAGYVLVYVDDVLIMSNTVEEGIVRLRDVLKTLTDAGFSINLGKCSFLATKVEYLGRVVSQGQVGPSPRKVEALVNAPIPSNVRQVRQFLGLAGYFRRYIKNYATKTACISRLTKNNVEFCWGPEQEQVRQEIITHLTSEPILSIFDPQLQTELHTDASGIGYGAVLMQTWADGTKHVVSYYSKATQGAERKYHSYELETLAVVRALQHFRHYLIGLKFKIVTDCNALKATQNKKDLLPRVARWWVYLQDFDFDIEYRKGVMMSHADYLSRNPSTQVHHITKPRNWAQIAQSADSETQTLLQKLRDGELDTRRYVNQNDLLYYRYEPMGEEPRLLCFIPKGHRLSLLRIFHDEHEHIGVDKVLHLVLKHFWFPGLRQFVAKYIAHCLVCVSKKRVPRAPHQPITSWEKPNVPFHTLHLDVLGPLPESNGYKFVLLMIDAFSKFCLLYPIYRQDVGELKRTFTEAVSLFGAPKLLITDRGRMFESAEFIRFLTDIGCDIHHITPEMHHANGQVERYARTVLNMIRIEANHKGASWSEQLWRLQLVLNMTKQKTTQHSALNLLVGIDAVTPVLRSLIRDVAIDNSQQTPRDAWRELCRARANDLLKKNQAQQDTTVNRQRRPPRKFNIDDLVFVIKYSQSTGKLDPGMRGPYRVLKALPSDRYELKLLSGSYGKTTQAAAEYLVPWRGEWCPDTCAAFFEYPVPVPEAKFEDASQRSCNETDDSEAGSSASQGEAQPSGPSSVPGPARTPQEVVEDDS